VMFLMLATGVFAMIAPIRIQVESGNDVRINVRNSTTGVTIGNYKDAGIADENGLFETRLYSLSPATGVVYHVKTFSGLTLLQDKQFDISEVSEPLLLDCTSECVSSIYDYVVEEESTVEVEEVVEVVINDSVEEEIIEEENSESGVTGKAIFVNENGSINWIYSIGAGFVILLFVVFMVFMVRHSKKGRGKKVVEEKKGLDDDEKELEEMEKKVKDTEDKIKNVKDKKVRRTKIYDAKVKLAKEERELEELEESGSKTDVDKQEDVVEKAEDKVDDVIKED